MVFGLSAGFCGVRQSQTDGHSLLTMGPRAQAKQQQSEKSRLCASEWEAEAADSPAQGLVMLPEAASGPTARPVLPPLPPDSCRGSPTLHTCPGWGRIGSSVFPEIIYALVRGGDWECPEDTELASRARGRGAQLPPWWAA